MVADPVAHSLSPLLHNTAFARDGLNKVYLPIRVPQGMFPLMFDQFQSLGLRGLSVTLPHKETALTLTTNTEGPIQEIGAANTLHLDNAGTWWAANTDYDAALESILLGLGGGTTPAPARELEGKRVLILGAGGSGPRRRMGDREGGRGGDRRQPGIVAWQGVGRRARLSVCVVGESWHKLFRHPRELHVRRHASERRRDAASGKPPERGGLGVRYGLQPRTDHARAASSRTRLSRRHRNRNVRAAGRQTVRALRGNHAVAGPVSRHRAQSDLGREGRRRRHGGG